MLLKIVEQRRGYPYPTEYLLVDVQNEEEIVGIIFCKNKAKVIIRLWNEHKGSYYCNVCERSSM